MSNVYLCTKVDSSSRMIHMKKGSSEITKKILASVKVPDGTLYLSGVTVVAVWERDVLGRPFEGAEGIETWGAPDLRNSRANFVRMVARLI